jgi:DNA repair exonuclease SbcCD ATPase subunit/energy-coupling factor transporter ATP-binding protein EcfA2
MADSPITSALHFAQRPILRLSRIALFAPSGRLFHNSAFEITIPGENLVIVLGQNGSGKSLLTAAAQLALGPDVSANELRADLLGAGIEQIEIGLDYSTFTGRLLLAPETGERKVQWYPPAESHNGHHASDGFLQRTEGGTWENLFGTDAGATIFAQVNFIRGGDAELFFNDDLLIALREEALEPTRRELRGWRARLHDLGGEQGSDGKLRLAREQLREVKDRILYVEEVRAKLDQAQQLQTSLQAQFEELGSQQNMVKAELEEWMRLATLADRARRVRTWLDEIQREYAEVAWLREQHEKYQKRLDDLEKVFRSAPDNLDEVLESFQMARQEETALLEKLNQMRMQGAQLEETIAAARKELDACAPPSAGTERAEHEQRRVRVEEAELELTELLRGRVELIRQREGLQLHLQRDFPLFLDLDAAARLKLEAYFEWEEKAEQRLLERKRSAAEARHRAEEKVQLLRAELTTSFLGFDGLPYNVSDSLRVLSDCRRLAESIRSDQQGLERKRALLQDREKGSKKQVWTVAAGLLGAILGGVLGGWDVALFFALVASSATMLVGRYLGGGVGKQLDETLVALNEVEARRQETDAMIARLETAIGPLGRCNSFDEALGRLNRYRQIQGEIEQLSQSLSAEHGVIEDADRQARDDFACCLPARLLAMPVAAARAQFSNFRQVEQSLKSLDSAWNEYGDRGEKSRAIREIEARVVQLRQEFEQIVSDSERRMHAHEVRRRELNEQLTVLESARAVGQTVDEVESNLIRVRKEQDRLISQSGAFLDRSDSDVLAEQVRLLRELRTEIRKVRDSLSSRQSPDELRAREALLAEELEEVKQKLTALDPLYLLDGTVADYSAKYNRQLEQAGEALALNERALEPVKRDLEAVEVDHWTSVYSACESLESLQERATASREHLERVEHEAGVARETVLQLQADHDEHYRDYESEFLSAAAQSVRSLSDGRCRGLNYSSGRLTVELPDGSLRPLSALSAGMRDLVWMALRLTLLDQRSDSPLTPVIWDEPFSRLDDHFLERVRGSLSRAEETRQVVILTRDHRLRKWGTVVELPTDITESELIHA